MLSQPATFSRRQSQATRRTTNYDAGSNGDDDDEKTLAKVRLAKEFYVPDRLASLDVLPFALIFSAVVYSRH